MSEGIHGTLRVGTAGELTGRIIEETRNGMLFLPDGLSDSNFYPFHFATFTPDAPALPTRPLAVIETDDKGTFLTLDRHGFWIERGGSEWTPGETAAYLSNHPWHVVFEGVEEQ